MSSEWQDVSQGVERRVFVKGLGYVTMGVVLTLFGGCERFCQSIKNRPTRRRLRSGSAEVDSAIATYKNAVTLMRGLPSSDPRSWSAQAALHGTVGGGFNFCQHGTNHFFSWHRAYLLYFEQICQALTGDKSFGLPYWNWNQDPAMHPEFTAAGSPLAHPRTRTSVAGNSAFSTATLDTILGDSNFFTFSSQLEGTPHNIAHGWIGGDMGTGGSPLDPVFWAHHCIVDYCWAKWNIELDNDNTNDPAWVNTSWDHFVDGQGNPVTATAGLTPIMPLLSYQYESSAIGSAGARAMPSAAELKTLEARLRAGIEVRFEVTKHIVIAERVSVSLGRPFSKDTRVSAQDFSALIESDRTKERIFASISYVQAPPTNDFFVRVFLNLPTASADTPIDDPHYAGSFAFFGTDSGQDAKHQGKTDFLVNVTDTLQALRRGGELAVDRPISLQLVAVPLAGELAKPDAELILEKLELVVSPMVIRSR